MEPASIHFFIRSKLEYFTLRRECSQQIHTNRKWWYKILHVEQAALKYHQWVINNDSSLISWGLGDCKSSDVSRNSFSSVTIILHFWTEGYKNSNDDIFHCQEFFNNRRLQLQDNFHICTFVLTRGHLVYILKPGIHTLEPVGTRTGRFGTVREKFKNLEKYRTSSHIPVRWSLLETTLEVIPL